MGSGDARDDFKYQVLFDYNLDAVFLTCPDGTISRANAAACELFGLTEADFQRLGRDAIVEQGQALSEGLGERARSGRVRTTLTYIKGDGSRFAGDTMSVVVPGEVASECESFVIVRDVSEARRAEEAVRERNEYIETVLENAPIGFAVNTIDDGVVRFASRRFGSIHGLEPGWSVTSVEDYFETVYRDPAQREEMRARILADLASGDPARMTWENVPLRTASGEVRYITSVNIPLFDRNLMVSTVQDVTGRVLAERAMRESETRFMRLVEAAPEAIFVQTRGRFAYVNEAALRLFGASSPGEVIGTPVTERIHPADRENVTKRIQRLDEDRVPVPLMEETVLRLDGTPVTVEAAGAPITYENQPGAVVFARDVTERKRLEAQLLEAQRMESVGRLAGGVAHDFNNMLSVILGYADLLLSARPPGDPARADLEEIRDAARRSAELTHQLLAFARRQTLSPQVVNLNESVAGTLRMLQRLIGEDVELEWRPGEHLWSVRIDPSQVDQILANLVVNARDAMPAGGRITLETSNERVDERVAGRHPSRAPGEYVRLSVSDTGTGMAPEALRHVFEPFFTTKPMGKGTGLGLATVYGIVTQHGGTIDVASEPGSGTTFEMWFPRQRAPAGRLAAAAAEAPPGGTETVLLVEDFEPILKLARSMLTRLGYRVLSASRAEDAIEQAAACPGEIHLLLTDVVMPAMNGRDLASQLRGARPSLRVLYMSGYTANVIAHHGVLDEGVHFVQKPFTLPVLARAVREALDASPAR